MAYRSARRPKRLDRLRGEEIAVVAAVAGHLERHDGPEEGGALRSKIEEEEGIIKILYILDINEYISYI